MDKLKKAIIKWLLGNDWEEYWELHHKYLKQLDEMIKVLDDNLELRHKLIEEKEHHLKSLEEELRIIKDNKSLYEICKANGIEVEKDDYFSLS